MFKHLTVRKLDIKLTQRRSNATEITLNFTVLATTQSYILKRKCRTCSTHPQHHTTKLGSTKASNVNCAAFKLEKVLEFWRDLNAFSCKRFMGKQHICNYAIFAPK